MSHALRKERARSVTGNSMTKTEAKVQRLLLSNTEITGRDMRRVRSIRVANNYGDAAEERKARSKVKLLTDKKWGIKRKSKVRLGPSAVRRNTWSLGR